MDIADDVESRFDTSGYNPDRPLPVGRNKKVIGSMKDELGGGGDNERIRCPETQDVCLQGW